MKRYKGRITIGLILVILAIGVTWMVTQDVKAAEWNAHTITLHKSMGFTTIGDAYAIISATSSCDMYDSGGAVDAVYADAAITFTADEQYTDKAMASMPALPKGLNYDITFYENSSPTAGDTAKIATCRWDAEYGFTFSDTNPVTGTKVRTAGI